MIDLYFWTTPNGYKVTILLEELGLPYNIIPVHIGKGEQFNSEFLRISPNNKIPALVDHDGPGGLPIAVFESGAIMMYLAEKSGWRFMPTDMRQRYDVMQWLMFQMAVSAHVRPSASFPPLRARTNSLRGRALHQRSESIYRVIDKRLGEAQYLAGDYSIADMATYPWLRPHKWQGQDLADFPNLSRWYADMRARPAVQRGLAVLKERLERNKEKPSGDSWNALFGKQQYEAR